MHGWGDPLQEPITILSFCWLPSHVLALPECPLWNHLPRWPLKNQHQSTPEELIRKAESLLPLGCTEVAPFALDMCMTLGHIKVWEALRCNMHSALSGGWGGRQRGRERVSLLLQFTATAYRLGELIMFYSLFKYSFSPVSNYFTGLGTEGVLWSCIELYSVRSCVNF